MAKLLGVLNDIGNAYYDFQMKDSPMLQQQQTLQKLREAQTGSLLQKMEDDKSEQQALSGIDFSQYDNPYEPFRIAAEKATHPRVKMNLMTKYAQTREAHFKDLGANLTRFKDDPEVFNQVLKSDAYKEFRKQFGVPDNAVVNLQNQEMYYTHDATPDNPLETPEGRKTEGTWEVKKGPRGVKQWIRKDKDKKTPSTISYERGDQHITEIYENGELVRTETAPRYKPPGPEKGRSPHEIGKDTASLRKEFNNLPEIKEYNMTRNKIGAMEAAYTESKKTGNFVATDQAMITLFNKMTDPQSVVRESEYSRTGVNLPLINKLKGKIAKIGAGGAGLTQADRDAIIKMARLFDASQKEVYRRRADEYRGYAKEQGLDPDSIAKTDNIKSDPLGIR